MQSLAALFEKSSDRGVFAGVGGCFDQMSPMCGHEHLLVGMAEDPDWVREMAALAAESGAQILLYPHSYMWMERIEDAVRVADAADEVLARQRVAAVDSPAVADADLLGAGHDAHI